MTSASNAPDLPTPQATTTTTAAPAKTLVTLLLDRTGSMQSAKDDTLGAVNAWKEELAQATGDVRLSIVLFDEHQGRLELKKLHVAKPVAEVPDLTSRDYVPRGSTPLIDAACATIRAIDEALQLRSSSEPVKVVLAIQTDGQENASRENSWEDLKALVAEKEAVGWEFSFMGAGIDAYAQGARMGIAPEKTISYGKDRAGSLAAFAALGENTRLFASGEKSSAAYSVSQKRAAGDTHDGSSTLDAQGPGDPDGASRAAGGRTR